MTRNVRVILQPVKFRRITHVAVLYLNSPEVDDVIREIEGAEWSTGYRFWHVPYKEGMLDFIIKSLRKIANVDASAFQDFVLPEKEIEIISKGNKPKKIKVQKPTSDQLEKLKNIEDHFIKLGYSNGTAKVYSSLLKVYFGLIGYKSDELVTADEIYSAIEDYTKANALTHNYKKLLLNAISRYYGTTDRSDLTQL
jgi:hypothetical protein